MTAENILPWVQAVLRTTPRRWIELAGSLPSELLLRPPAPGEWSAVECLQHILDTEDVFNFRLNAFLKGQDFPAFNPDTQGTRPIAPNPVEMAAGFERMRRRSLDALAALGPADLTRRAHHAELGPVTLAEMLNEWAAHDFNHTIQAERALMQPFIAGCGPWQKYFQDHVIRSS